METNNKLPRGVTVRIKKKQEAVDQGLRSIASDIQRLIESLHLIDLLSDFLQVM